MGGGGLRVVERNGRVAGVFMAYCGVSFMCFNGRVGPARSARIRMLRLRAAGAKGENQTGVCSSVCSVTASPR